MPFADHVDRRGKHNDVRLHGHSSNPENAAHTAAIIVGVDASS
jgi:hypothetical protein